MGVSKNPVIARASADSLVGVMVSNDSTLCVALDDLYP